MSQTFKQYHMQPVVIVDPETGERITAFQVVFPEGATVALADGTEVTLAADTAVGLAEGSQIALAEGTEVALAEGTSVALAENTEVLSVIKGSSQDLRGLHTARPDADAVDEGTTYWSVNEPSAPGTIYVSDGANWTVVAAL